MPRKKFRNYWRFLFPGNSNKKTDSEKLLVVITDHKLNFEEHACVCVCVSLRRKGLFLTEQNNKYSARVLIGDGMLLKYFCIKDLCLHVQKQS